MQGLLASAAFAGLLLSPPKAEPDPVAVLPLAVEGELSPEVARDLEARIMAGFERAGRGARPVSVSPNCAEDDAACWSEAAHAEGVAAYLSPSVLVEGRTYAFRLRFVTKRGENIVHEAACEICGIAEVATRLEDEVAVALPRLRVIDVEVPMLSVKSAPSGASVYLDGELVGTTPYLDEVSEGKHVVDIRVPGHAPRTRNVVAAPGLSVDLEVELESLSEAKRPLHPGIGGGLVGVGVVGVALGGTLWGIDERPRMSDCSGSNIDDDGDCRFRYATKEAGIGLLVVGGAAIVTGAALIGVSLARRGKKSKPSNDQAAGRFRVTPTLHGVAFRF